MTKQSSLYIVEGSDLNPNGPSPLGHRPTKGGNQSYSAIQHLLKYSSMPRNPWATTTHMMDRLYHSGARWCTSVVSWSLMAQHHLLSIYGSVWHNKGIKMVHHVPRWSMMAQHLLHGATSLLDGATSTSWLKISLAQLHTWWRIMLSFGATSPKLA